MVTTRAHRFVPRRQFLAFLSAAATGALAAACSQPTSPATSSPPQASDSKPTAPASATPAQASKPAASAPASGKQSGSAKVITFWQESNSPAANQGWDALTETFRKAHPDIEVKRVFQTEMSNIIKVALASDTGPDVFQRDIPPSYHQPLVDANLVVAMDDYYKSHQNLQKVFPWAKKRATINGKVWGVPHEVEFIPIFYNKGVFEKVGITKLPSSSYDEFLTLCKTMKDAGTQPLGLAGRSRTQPGHLYSILAMLTVGKEGFERILYEEGRWDQEGMVEAATRMKELLDLGYLAKDAVAQEGPAVQAAFAAGRYAMWPTGTWSMAGFEDSKKGNASFEYDYFIPPVLNSQLQNPHIAGGIGGGFSISSKAKDRDASAIWIDFLMSPDAQKIWNSVLYQAAPTPFDASSSDLPETPKKAMGLISKGEELGYNISVVIPSNVVEMYWNGLGGILSGQITPADWASKVQAEWEKAKAEGRVLKP